MKQNMGVVLSQEDVSQSFKLWFLGLSICGLVFGLDRLHLLVFPRGLVERVVWMVDQKIVGVTQKIFSPLSIIPETLRRQERVATLEQQLSQAAVDRRRLIELEGKVEMMESMVVSHQSGARASTLTELYMTQGEAVVGLGEAEGIIKGQAITDKNGVLVGRVGSVGRYVSRVDRVGTEGLRIPAQTVSGGAKGVVYSEAGGVILGEVLQTESLTEGEIVITTGVMGGFPPGLVIGQIKSIRAEAANVTKEAVISLLAQQTGWVAIW